MKIFLSDQFHFPLPEGHRFPVNKYALLRQRVQEANLVDPYDLQVAPPATEEEILRVHTPQYWHRVVTGTLTEKEIRRIGIPWSPEMVERTRRTTGATLQACRAALIDGFAASLAGGTHHAYPDHGEGYCVLNDVAIASRAIQIEGLAKRLVILDCDVHQGNGTAAIFSNESSVFTFSIHGAKNFPFHKEPGDLDIALEDGCGDDEYLQALRIGLEQAITRSQADLAIYIAGADPHIDDRLGRLSLTKAGLLARDKMVFDMCLDGELSVAVVMGGGYGRKVEDTVDIHFQTIRLAVNMSSGKALPGGLTFN